MKKSINAEKVVTSRRNVLRGTALAGAAALTGGVAHASMMPRPVPSVPRMHRSSPVITVESASGEMAEAAPADLSGLERVRQELVDPPFAPEHEQVASGPPKIVEIEMVTHERLMTIDEDTGASIWALTSSICLPERSRQARTVGALVPGVREEGLRIGVLEDLAVGHEDDAVSGLAGEAHLVSDDHHGHPLAGEVGHECEDALHQFRVEC